MFYQDNILVHQIIKLWKIMRVIKIENYVVTNIENDKK